MHVESFLDREDRSRLFFVSRAMRLATSRHYGRQGSPFKIVPWSCMQAVPPDPCDEWTAIAIMAKACRQAPLEIMRRVICYAKSARSEAWMKAAAFMGDTFATNGAAVEGRIDCLELLRANGFSWSKGTVIAAALGGHVECLRYLHDSGCPLEKTHGPDPSPRESIFSSTLFGYPRDDIQIVHTACEAAALRGHIDCLRYLHDEAGHAMQQEVVEAACLGGSVDCLRFAHENAAPPGGGL